MDLLYHIYFYSAVKFLIRILSSYLPAESSAILIYLLLISNKSESSIKKKRSSVIIKYSVELGDVPLHSRVR